MISCYKDKHEFLDFHMAGEDISERPQWREQGFPYPFNRKEEGPIFPRFISADFSSFEGWKKFAKDYGLEGFMEFDQELEKELKRRIADVRKNYVRGPISITYLKQRWENMKKKILVEQTGVKRFFDFQQTLYATGKSKVTIKGLIKSERSAVWDACNFEPFGDLTDVIPFLNRVKLRWEFNDWPVFSTSLNFKKEVNQEEMKEVFRPIWDYDKSLVARCYAEIVWLIKDGRTVKPCTFCHEPFVPERSDADYCKRVYWTPRTHAQYERIRGQELTKENIEKEAQKFLERHTCRKIGPLITFHDNLTEEEKEYRAEKKRRDSKLRHLKKTRGEESSEYKKELRAWKKFLKDHRHLEKSSMKKGAKS